MNHPEPSAGAPNEPRRVARRALGVLLLAAAYLPAHRLLDLSATGVAGMETRSAGDALWTLMGTSTVLAAAVAAALAWLLPRPALDVTLARAADRVLTRGTRTIATAAGATALLLCVAAALLIFRGLPTLVDAMTQLLQARAWAHGALAAPAPDPVASRTVQNGLNSPIGWVSIYPPAHTALLALGMSAGTPWLVGPLLTGITAAFSAAAALRLLPERPRAALLGAAFVALSPFVVLLGSGYLSHASAAAAAAITVWAALRARDGAPGWAAVAGLATGVMVASRPWVGLVLGSLSPAVWLLASAPRRAIALRLSLWALGGVPIAIALGAYDLHAFGGALRLGYDVAFGPAHGLGLHRDPWGAMYGVRAALAYTGFDLMALGGHLLETPVSAVGLVGAWLLLTPRLSRGAGLLLGWALLPVLANAFYWHHGYHLGPRMLLEAAPAWCVLTALAWMDLARSPGRWGAFFLWLAVVSAPAALFLDLPQRVAASRWSDDAVLRATVPRAADGGLVFVHGSWPGRVAARLAAAGMRRDSIETALRRNDLCRVDAYARALEAGGMVAGSRNARPPVDFEPLPGSPPSLGAIEVAPGTFARIDPTVSPDAACRREAAADRFGTVELEPLLWQTPVAGLEEGGPLLFRDLGPEANARVLARHPGRTAWVMRAPGADALLPYEEAEREMWGETGP